MDAAIRRLVESILKGSNQFYQKRLHAAGITSEKDLTTEAFTRALGFTTKAEIIADKASHPPYGTNLTQPLNHYTRFCQTSGTSSGQPMAWLDTPESWQALLDCWQAVFKAADVSAEDRVLFAFSFGPFLGFWTAFEAAIRSGCLSFPGGGLSSSSRIQLMKHHQISVLCCTPTYALRLGEVSERKITTLRRIIVAGEPGGSLPGTRARIESLWPGATVFDHHGLTEIGPVTFEHPRRPGTLCLVPDAYLAEVIDPTGTEVGDGETGELVLTTLTRISSPLLRYRTGDLVKKRLENGALTLEGGILGRIDDMVLVRGVNVYPSAIENLVQQFPEIRDFEVREFTRNSMTELQVAIETTDQHTAKRLETSFQDHFSLRIPVVIAPTDSLPRYEFKSARWRKIDAEF